MRKIYTAISILTIYMLGVPGKTQAQITNLGTEFWVGYGHHQFMEPVGLSAGSNAQNMVLYFSTGNQPATVTITLDSSSFTQPLWWRKTYNVPANSVVQSDIIPKGVIDAAASGSDPNYDVRLFTDPPPAGTGSAGLYRKKGLRITSTAPVAAYAHIYGSASAGATMLLPVTAWGTSYTSVNNKQKLASNAYSWLYVMASEDNTRIQVTTPVKIYASNKLNIAPNTPANYTLMRGQIFLFQGANVSSDANGNGGIDSSGYELTGTTVRSIENSNGNILPIAVFAGSSRTIGSTTCGAGDGENDFQQLFPQKSWGRRYLTAPFSAGGSVSSFATSSFKIMTMDAATVVKRNGVVMTGIINDKYYLYESNTADYIESDKPVMVAQFMAGECAAGTQGDADMVFLTPKEQAINQSYFTRTNLQSIENNFATVIIPTNGIASMLIDGVAAPTSADFIYPHPRLFGYSVVTKKWTAAKALSTITSDSVFTGITYGLGLLESYAFNIGGAFNDISNTPLPVKITSLSASVLQNDVVVNWKTASEQNVAIYNVERSTDARTFVNAGSVAAVPATSSNHYAFTDNEAAKNYTGHKHLFYRLQMIDKDGTATYSQIAKVYLDDQQLDIAVSPNPFVSVLNVSFNAPAAGKISISIKDATGRNVMNNVLSVYPGINRISLPGVEGLAKGLYILSVEWNGRSTVLKVVK